MISPDDTYKPESMTEQTANRRKVVHYPSALNPAREFGIPKVKPIIGLLVWLCQDLVLDAGGESRSGGGRINLSTGEADLRIFMLHTLVPSSQTLQCQLEQTQ